MIGVDTNVIVRFLAQDDEVQSPIATRFMSKLSRERPGFISAIVLAEITWVLSRSYRSSRKEISRAVEGLLRSAELIVENADAAYRALGVYQASDAGEYADALIADRCARRRCRNGYVRSTCFGVPWDAPIGLGSHGSSGRVRFARRFHERPQLG